MVTTLPRPVVLRRYFDDGVGLLLPAFELRWDDFPGERLWELPEGVCMTGPPPRRFGIAVERAEADGYMVKVLWDRTHLLWTGLTRVQLLTSALASLMRLLGIDLRSDLEKPVRGGAGTLRKVA